MPHKIVNFRALRAYWLTIMPTNERGRKVTGWWLKISIACSKFSPISVFPSNSGGGYIHTRPQMVRHYIVCKQTSVKQLFSEWLNSMVKCEVQHRRDLYRQCPDAVAGYLPEADEVERSRDSEGNEFSAVDKINNFCR